MFYIRTIIIISLFALLVNSYRCVQAAPWKQSVLEHDLDLSHEDENPFALEEIHDADEFDDDEHIADPQVLEQLDEILEKLFDDQGEDVSNEELSVEKVSSLIGSAHKLFSELPPNYEIDDRFNQRNQIIDDLHELSADLGCLQSELNKRKLMGLVVWDNKRLMPYIKMQNAKQLDLCRARLEEHVLAVAKSENIPSPSEESHLNELRQQIELVSSNNNWIEMPADQLDDIAAKGVENMLKKSTSSDNLNQVKTTKTTGDIALELDDSIKKDCNHIWGKFYFQYDDATVLDQISRELINESQWDSFRPKVRNLLESVSACTAIRNI